MTTNGIKGNSELETLLTSLGRAIMISMVMVGLCLLWAPSVLAAWPHIIYPNDQGVILVKGQTYTILWGSVHTDPVDIVLCTEDTPGEVDCFYSIARNVPNSESYSWTVSSNIPNGANYVIGVGVLGVSIAFSDYPFTITDSAPPPIADFNAIVNTGIAPLVVPFNDTSTGIISNWLWTFGDGGTGTQQNPSHTFTTPGNYTVSLTVTGPGGSDTETKQQYITVNYPSPEAAFSANQTVGVAPLSVDFTDQSNGNISSWSWTFGDGGTGTQQNPSHTFTTPGNYTVSLTVTGPGGSDTETKEHIVKTAYPGGDINNDNLVNLSDSILVLQVIAKVKPQPLIPKISDINGDMRIGLEEAIYILQFVSEY